MEFSSSVHVDSTALCNIAVLYVRDSVILLCLPDSGSLRVASKSYPTLSIPCRFMLFMSIIDRRSGHVVVRVLQPAYSFQGLEKSVVQCRIGLVLQQECSSEEAHVVAHLQSVRCFLTWFSKNQSTLANRSQCD